MLRLRKTKIFLSIILVSIVTFITIFNTKEEESGDGHKVNDIDNIITQILLRI